MKSLKKLKAKKSTKNDDRQRLDRGWQKLSNQYDYKEYHPCLHRWLEIHPKPPEPRNKREIIKPTPQNIIDLAQPLCRRLVNVWVSNSEILPKFNRDTLLSRLENCGFTKEQLDYLVQERKRQDEIRQRIANAGPFDIFDENGNLLTPERRIREKKKVRKEKKKEQIKKIKKKRPKVSETQSKKTKKRKPRDDGIAYKPGKRGQLKAGWGHKIGVQLLLKILNLTDAPLDEEFISMAPSYYIIQARALLDVVSSALGITSKDDTVSLHFYRLITGCLNLAVWLAQNVTTPAQSIRDEQIEKLLAARGQTTKLLSQGENTANIYLWRQNPQTYETIPDNLEETDETSDYQLLFIEMPMWYDPFAPEFMYGGKREAPKFVQFEIGEDHMHWRLSNVDMAWQNIAPCALPTYFGPLLLNELSGSKEQNTWYIMSPTEFYKERSLKWTSASTTEVFEMVFDLVYTLVTTPDITMNRLLELVNELCMAVELNDDDSDDYNELDAKRTIIFENLFVTFFGTAFRDFDENTVNYMRVLCRKGSILIRDLYEYTALTLWRLQQNEEEVEGEESESFLSDMEDGGSDDELHTSMEDWNDWLKFQSESLEMIGKWQNWLNEMSEIEQPEDPTNLISEAENWLETGSWIMNTFERDFWERVMELGPALRKVSLD